MPMIVRAMLMLMASCLCLTHGEADARRKARPKRAASLDISRLTIPAERRDWRAQRWIASDPGKCDSSDAAGIRWRLRGAGVKMRMPITLHN